ncbi:hypothetical protein AZI87_10425 [Bdellovibrio bacteriovorus]|uniref:Uncharacterized protein n=1 Tax=Bdellovibrio bacteriovorus TaxID=959 RepID=A0A161PVG8_BDEBC|nr:hypothetical protein [Bdellovibrio bacteriovorus]KYG69578.1 hypothetical protein AZI87_10425 [Bdellovibrio bacteriovorus]
MKKIAFFAVLFASLTAFAADLTGKATLDLTNTYGGFNAGLYEVTVQFTANNQVVTSEIKRSQRHDDGENFCVSSLNFKVGTLVTTVKNVITGNTLVRTMDLTATTSIQNDNEECVTTASDFAKETAMYVTTSQGPWVLPVAPPKGWDQVQVWLNPFNTLTVFASLTEEGGALKFDTTNLFNASLFNTNHNRLELFHYLTAVEGSGTLSLSVANVPMYLVK